MNTVLRISESLSLAFHAAAYLAAAGGDTVSAARIASDLGVSANHLAKVMKRLAARGIVHSWPGPGGGYTLARPPAEINLLDVYEAVEGPLETDGCLLEDCPCGEADCPLGAFVKRVGREFAERLAATRLADFPALKVCAERRTTR